MCERHNSNHEHVCTVNVTSTANVFQSLNEMEFERGIWYASQTGDIERVIKLVMRQRQDVNQIDSAGYTSLHYAARNGYLEICKFLIQNGANVNAITRAGHATPLHRACSAGHANVVKYLLERGADLNMKDGDGKNCLHRAITNGNVEICKLIAISVPKLQEEYDNHGKIPMDYAKTNINLFKTNT